MSAVCNTLIHSWGVPMMNVKIIETYTNTVNRGSLRVFEKNRCEALPLLAGLVVTESLLRIVSSW